MDVSPAVQSGAGQRLESAARGSEYAMLSRRVRQAGLLERYRALYTEVYERSAQALRDANVTLDVASTNLAALVDAARANSAYFRLLARDPDALRARTLADKDIFYNPDAGLPRAERELVAAAASRFNGCIYCASVHSRFSATYSKREADVQRLLDEGVDADLGERWNAIVAAAVALSATPEIRPPKPLAALVEKERPAK